MKHFKVGEQISIPGFTPLMIVNGVTQEKDYSDPDNTDKVQIVHCIYTDKNGVMQSMKFGPQSQELLCIEGPDKMHDE